MKDLLEHLPAMLVSGVIQVRQASFPAHMEKNSKLGQIAKNWDVLCIFFHNSLGYCYLTFLFQVLSTKCLKHLNFNVYF